MPDAVQYDITAVSYFSAMQLCKTPSRQCRRRTSTTLLLHFFVPLRWAKELGIEATSTATRLDCVPVLFRAGSRQVAEHRADLRAGWNYRARARNGEVESRRHSCLLYSA